MVFKHRMVGVINRHIGITLEKAYYFNSKNISNNEMALASMEKMKKDKKLRVHPILQPRKCWVSYAESEKFYGLPSCVHSMVKYFLKPGNLKKIYIKDRNAMLEAKFKKNKRTISRNIKILKDSGFLDFVKYLPEEEYLKQVEQGKLCKGERSKRRMVITQTPFVYEENLQIREQKRISDIIIAGWKKRNGKTYKGELSDEDLCVFMEEFLTKKNLLSSYYMPFLSIRLLYIMTLKNKELLRSSVVDNIKRKICIKGLTSKHVDNIIKIANFSKENNIDFKEYAKIVDSLLVDNLTIEEITSDWHNNKEKERMVSDAACDVGDAYVVTKPIHVGKKNVPITVASPMVGNMNASEKAKKFAQQSQSSFGEKKEKRQKTREEKRTIKEKKEAYCKRFQDTMESESTKDIQRFSEKEKAKAKYNKVWDWIQNPIYDKDMEDQLTDSGKFVFNLHEIIDRAKKEKLKKTWIPVMVNAIYITYMKKYHGDYFQRDVSFKLFLKKEERESLTEEVYKEMEGRKINKSLLNRAIIGKKLENIGVVRFSKALYFTIRNLKNLQNGGLFREGFSLMRLMNDYNLQEVEQHMASVEYWHDHSMFNEEYLQDVRHIDTDDEHKEPVVFDKEKYKKELEKILDDMPIHQDEF